MVFSLFLRHPVKTFKNWDFGYDNINKARISVLKSANLRKIFGFNVMWAYKRKARFADFKVNHNTVSVNAQAKMLWLGDKKQENLFCGWTDLPSQVGWLGLFLKFLVAKHYPKKHRIFSAKVFLENTLIIFNIFQTKFKNFGQKTTDFTRFWQIKKEKENSPKTEINGSVRPVKQGFFFRRRMD